MASTIITSFFTNNGVPEIGLTPTIRIWEVNGTDQTLIIGAPEGTGDPGTGVGTDGIMTEMYDSTSGVPGGGSPLGGSRDGFYQFEFTSAMGFSPSKRYVVRADGGNTLSGGERYQTAEIAPSVWEEARTDHLTPGSTGEALNQIKASTDDIINKLYLDADSVLEVVQLLLKMEAGRTRIDPATNTLTIYDEDCTTILRVFNLYDSSGTPSVVDVCERKPVAKGPSDTTTITDVCP